MNIINIQVHLAFNTSLEYLFELTTNKQTWNIVVVIVVIDYNNDNPNHEQQQQRNEKFP